MTLPTHLIKTIILSLVFWALISPCFAADLIEGTNAGFVTVAPTADPEADAGVTDFYAVAIQVTAPATGTVTEIGWWCDNTTEEANYEVGLYDNDGEPNNLLGSDKTNAKGTTSGWKRASGLNISITSGIVYWIALQLDNTASTTNTNFTASQGIKRDYQGAGVSTLPDPTWGNSTATGDRTIAYYALYTTVTAKPQLIMIYD